MAIIVLGLGYLLSSYRGLPNVLMIMIVLIALYTFVTLRTTIGRSRTSLTVIPTVRVDEDDALGGDGNPLGTALMAGTRRLIASRRPVESAHQLHA